MKEGAKDKFQVYLENTNYLSYSKTHSSVARDMSIFWMINNAIIAVESKYQLIVIPLNGVWVVEVGNKVTILFVYGLSQWCSSMQGNQILWGHWFQIMTVGDGAGVSWLWPIP